MRTRYTKVFGNESIQIPYKSEDEGLAKIVKIFKEKEPSLNWLDRVLKERSKDVEKTNEYNENILTIYYNHFYTDRKTKKVL